MLDSLQVRILTGRKQRIRLLLAVTLLFVLVIFTSARTSPVVPRLRDSHSAGTSLMKQRKFVAEPVPVIPLLVFVGLLVVIERRKLVFAPVPVPTRLVWDRDYNRPPPIA